MVEEQAGVLCWWEQEEAEPVDEMLFHSSAVRFIAERQCVAERVLSYRSV